jgi:hypothetical protein
MYLGKFVENKKFFGYIFTLNAIYLVISTRNWMATFLAISSGHPENESVFLAFFHKYQEHQNLYWMTPNECLGKMVFFIFQFRLDIF